MDLDTARTKFADRIAELRTFCTANSPWLFVCASAFVEYLAKLVDGTDRGGAGYKDFIVNWLSKVRPEYSSFTYKDGSTDLPIQMYHVLRCGIVHTLSLIPDLRGQAQGGRDSSIVLAHRSGVAKVGLKHLDGYSSTQTQDAALFVAEDFVDDIEAVVHLVFSLAVPGSPLEGRMLSWLAAHPLISAGA